MTITIQSEAINGYYICIEQDKFSRGYRVSICHKFEKYVGYPLRENYYGTIEQAKRRYSDLKRKAKREEI